MNDKKQVAGLSVGGSSILVVFVVLALTTFAALSMVSSQADHRLAQRHALSVQEYYQGDSQAEEKLAEIDAYLQRIRQIQQAQQVLFGTEERGNYLQHTKQALQNMEGLTILEQSNGLLIGYDAVINERQKIELRVLVEDLFPERDRYQVVSWRVVNTQNWEGGREVLQVWDGGDK